MTRMQQARSAKHVDQGAHRGGAFEVVELREFQHGLPDAIVAAERGLCCS